MIAPTSALDSLESSGGENDLSFEFPVSSFEFQASRSKGFKVSRFQRLKVSRFQRLKVSGSRKQLPVPSIQGRHLNGAGFQA
jgi:hypothetical protein